MPSWCRQTLDFHADFIYLLDMDKAENQEINITFQWMVGDTHPLEKFLRALVKNKYHHLITVTSRIIAFALTYFVTAWPLSTVDIWKVFLIALAGSYSLWVSWGFGIYSIRKLEKIMASNPENVGVNRVKIDRTGIRWDDEISRIYLSWQGIEDVVELNGSIWLKTSKTSGFFIPKRLFDSDSQISECLEMIAKFREKPTLPIHLNEDSQTPSMLQ